jgi:hypothetical protein
MVLKKGNWTDGSRVERCAPKGLACLERLTGYIPMPLPRIAVYHAEGRSMRSCYLLAFLLERWREAGFETLLLNDPAERVEADAAIAHVDTTVRPEAYDWIADR